MKSQVVFSHNSDEWGTPQDLFDKLNAEFKFTTDAAANTENHKVDFWYGPGGAFPDALALDDFRFQTLFLNPPYSMTKQFMEWVDKNRHTNTWVILLPSRTDTRWWHQYVWDEKLHQPRPGVQIRFVKGRLKFGGLDRGSKNKNSAPFPSVLIIMRG